MIKSSEVGDILIIECRMKITEAFELIFEMVNRAVEELSNGLKSIL